MSTPDTASEPRRQRRGRLNAPFPARGGRQSTPGTVGPLPRPRTRGGGPTVLNDRAEQRLLAAARARGAGAAKRGVLDPWILQGGDRVPYFAELAALRDRVIGRIGEDAELTEEAARLADARAETDVTRCEADTAMAEHRLREAQEQIETAKAQLDLLAQRSSRWNRLRDRIRARLEARWLETTFPSTPRAVRDDEDGDAGAGNAAGTDPGSTASGETASGDDGTRSTAHGDVPDVLEEVPRTGEVPNPAEPGRVPPRTGPAHAVRDDLRPATADAWEGLLKRPGLPGWLNWLALGMIFVVELPIYYAAFEKFHGIGMLQAQAQTAILALGTAFAMVFFPHVAGRILRWRPATGSVRASWIPTLMLIGVWGTLAGFLGVLRAKYLMQDGQTPPAGSTADGFSGLGGGTSTVSLVQSLHLSQTTVTAMFVALLVLSGGIGFLLGLFREHAYLDAYRTALEERAGLQALHQRSVAATEYARATVITAEARREDRRQATQDRVRSVHALYDAAAAAYLDGVATKSADPAVTESAMKLARAWPLLPAAAVTPDSGGPGRWGSRSSDPRR